MRDEEVSTAFARSDLDKKHQQMRSERTEGVRGYGKEF